ncbi:MAG: hypothetical protein RIR34_289 [Actinomycetota bacterium]|jgi:hypothetical protein
MGLSERERKVLEELERGLYADDADLANRFKKAADETPVRKTQRSAARMVAGSMVALGGISVVLVGAITHYMLIGVAGFALMLGGLLIASTAKPAGAVGSSGAQASSTAGAKKAKRFDLGGFFEERWDRRMNGQ